MRALIVINSLQKLNEAIAKGKLISDILDCEISLIYVKEQELFDFDITNFNVENANEIRMHIIKALKEQNLNWVVMAFEDDIIDNVNLQINRQKINLTIIDIKNFELIKDIKSPVLYNFKNRSDALIVLDEFLDINLKLIKKLTNNLKAILVYEFFIAEPTFDIMQPIPIDLELEEEIINQTKKEFLNWANENKIEAKFFIGTIKLKEIENEIKKSSFLITNSLDAIELALNDNKTILKV